jgi:hypothetical protein
MERLQTLDTVELLYPAQEISGGDITLGIGFLNYQ